MIQWLQPEYRIVRDRFAGYEVQWWRPWFPFWIQCNYTNTHCSIESAEAFAKRHANGGHKVVSYLGKLKTNESKN